MLTPPDVPTEADDGLLTASEIATLKLNADWVVLSACNTAAGSTEGAMHYSPGGMGVHFLNLQLIGAAPDPAKPQVLIYEPVGDKLQLVPAEWFVPVPAAAAAVCGLARNVRPPAPCRPSKFRLLVLTAYWPGLS